MKKQNRSTGQRICLLMGVGLLLVAGFLMIFGQWEIRSAAQKTDTYVQAIRNGIPEPQSAVPEARRDNTMPVLSIEGTDFVGILELPRYGSSLPVCAQWGRVSRYPSRFHGSIYDGTLQIGATTQAGQYDFYREISVGDTVCFTDMEGNRYTLVVTDLRYAKHADQEVLGGKDAALTVFIKNVYSFEYLIVFCGTFR